MHFSRKWEFFWLPGADGEVHSFPSPLRELCASGYAFAGIGEDGAVRAWGDPAFGGDCSAVQEQLKDWGKEMRGEVGLSSDGKGFAVGRVNGPKVLGVARNPRRVTYMSAAIAFRKENLRLALQTHRSNLDKEISINCRLMTVAHVLAQVFNDTNTEHDSSSLSFVISQCRICTSLVWPPGCSGLGCHGWRICSPTL